MPTEAIDELKNANIKQVDFYKKFKFITVLKLFK